MITGRRITDGRDLLGYEPGDYGKCPGENDHWWLCTPDGHLGTISASIHKIVEHEDGTITVSPSIGITVQQGAGFAWHGYLEKGSWRTC